MSAAGAELERLQRPGELPGVAARRWFPVVGVLLVLGAIVGARWSATRLELDPLAVGFAFGVVLGALALVGGVDRWRAAPGRPAARHAGLAAVAGIGFGLALLGLVAAGAALGGSAPIPGVGRPAAPFVPWAAITILVASGEEAVLRGRLFDAVRRAGGVAPALAVTTIAFALMHVPLYGWQVVPLDLAVGLGLAGLRLATGGVLAPATAHSVADLATWWLPG